MNELAAEFARGVDAFLRVHLAWGATAGVAAVIAAVVLARRPSDGWSVQVEWPVVVVLATVLAVREVALPAAALATVGWTLTTRRAQGTGVGGGELRPRSDAVLVVATLVTGFSLFGAMPDPEPTLGFLGAALVILVARRLVLDVARRVVPATAAGTGALGGLLVWLVVAGDGQRLRAAIAGVLCLTLWAAVVASRRTAPVVVLVAHSGLSLAASRWVGLAPDTGAALGRALPVVAAAVVVTGAVALSGRRP